MKLKTQLLFLFMIAALFLFTFQAVYIQQSTRLLKNNSEIYTQNLLHQVANNISSFTKSMEETAHSIAFNEYVQNYYLTEDPVLRYSYSKYIRTFLQQGINANDNIQDIFIISKESSIISCQNTPIFEIHNALLSLHGNYNSGEAFDPFFELVTTERHSKYYLYVTPIPLLNLPSYQLGCCVIVYNNQHIQKTLNAVTVTPDTSLYLFDSSQTVIASNDYDTIGARIPSELNLSGSTSKNISINGKPHLLSSFPIENAEWTITCTIPMHELMHGLRTNTLLGLLMSFLTLLIILGLSLMLWRNIAHPIQALREQMSNIGLVNIHQRLPISPDRENEISQIGQYINQMLEQTEALSRKIFNTQSSLYEAELLRREAELFALQNQINPHFLYNTLECIRDISLVYGAKEISSISTAMSKIFRYCIRRDPFVLVQDELACIQDYIKIIQIRYQNRFLITQEIEPALLTETMPKFILQPLIENAVYHGLELKSGIGTLSIFGRMVKESGMIEFEIADNGKGIPSEKLVELNLTLSAGKKPDESKSHTGVGLFNIHSRLTGQYGPMCGVHIESTENVGTHVFVRFLKSYCSRPC